MTTVTWSTPDHSLPRCSVLTGVFYSEIEDGVELYPKHFQLVWDKQLIGWRGNLTLTLQGDAVEITWCPDERRGRFRLTNEFRNRSSGWINFDATPEHIMFSEDIFFFSGQRSHFTAVLIKLNFLVPELN